MFNRRTNIGLAGNKQIKCYAAVEYIDTIYPKPF